MAKRDLPKDVAKLDAQVKLAVSRDARLYTHTHTQKCEIKLAVASGCAPNTNSGKSVH
jgi:hypothetical protein